MSPLKAGLIITCMLGAPGMLVLTIAIIWILL